MLVGMLDTTSSVDWKQQLVAQLQWHWDGQLRPRLAGMEDAEYHWEPVADCWGVRRRAPGLAGEQQPGTDEWTCDFSYPEPDPPPVTTIAWRVAHLAVGVFGARAQSHFGATFDGGPADYQQWAFARTAADGLRQLDATYTAWIDGARSLSADDLLRQVGEAEGPWAEHSMAELVLHISREAIHHGAEISLLRDLYGRQ